MVPTIIKENAKGYIRSSLTEELLGERCIQCFGSIDDELANSLIMQLQYLQKEDSEKPVKLYINSSGGNVQAGLAIYDVITNMPMEVHTYVQSVAASMAAILFIAGEKRYMLEHSKIMLHDPLVIGGVTGTATRIAEIGQEVMNTREILANIIAKHSGKKLREVYKITSKDTWFTAQEAIDNGFADEIMKGTW